jgi:DNA gyrase subunit A
MTEETNNQVEDSEVIEVAEETAVVDETESLVGTITESKYGKISHTSIVGEMEKSYLDYAMSVIVSRALPDVRDGLKPVHRRILFSMYKAGIHHTSAYKKSARIVGDVLGRYHPHGDSSVYMAMVRLAQDFSMRYQLIDGQGNFGSVDGDSPAAMRYTEARLEKITAELLTDLNKDTVDFADNFDGSMQEPTVLPGKLPNLLLMGSEGIAVGMATKIPPHNLTEVCQAIIETIRKGNSDVEENEQLKKDLEAANDKDNKIPISERIAPILEAEPTALAGNFVSDITIDEIMEFIQGPDFPTAGIMYDFKEIKRGYETGKGKVVVRAKAAIEEDKKGFKIVVTELPYQVNKARLIEKIADLVRDKKIVGIRDLNDDSDRNGMQITIELKRDARPKVVLNKLFKFTQLQNTFSMNVVALNSEGVPQLLNIKQILKEYIVHRQLVTVRRSQYELGEARDRAHILEGLLIALGHLDDVVEIIKKSPDTDTARQRLMDTFKLSEIQATAILEMQLKRLAALERQKIEDEYEQIKKTIIRLIKLLSKPQDILNQIVTDTEELITLYGDERKTKLIKGRVGEFSEEDLVANESTVIMLTETGYVKRLSPSSFRSQSRGGKGSVGVKMKDEDMVKSMLSAATHDTLFFFTNKGRVYKLKAFEIPEVKRQAKGTAIVNLLNLKPDERVQTVLRVDEEEDKEKFILLTTTKGLIKKSELKLYDNIRQNGIVAIALKKDDELVSGRLTDGENYIMLITHKGKSIKFSETEVKSSQRDTKGVKGITLGKEDYVVGFESFPKEYEEDNKAKKEFHHLLVITENGLGKRTKLSSYPLQKRSGMGVKVSVVNSKTGMIAAARMVTHENNEVVISTQAGQTIKLPISKKSIPTLGRATQGVILMRIGKANKIGAVALTMEEPPSEDASN